MQILGYRQEGSVGRKWIFNLNTSQPITNFEANKEQSDKRTWIQANMVRMTKLARKWIRVFWIELNRRTTAPYWFQQGARHCYQRQQDEQELTFLSSTIDTTIMPTKSEHVNNSDKQTMKNGSTREKSQSTRSTTSSHRLRSKTPTITLQGGNLTNWNWNLKTREINGVLFAWQNKLTKKTNLIIISFTRWLTPEEWLLAWL